MFFSRRNKGDLKERADAFMAARNAEIERQKEANKTPKKKPVAPKNTFLPWGQRNQIDWEDVD
mgnify:CR=1 FL=1